MSDVQLRVLLILAAAVAVEVGFDKTILQDTLAVATGKGGANTAFAIKAGGYALAVILLLLFAQAAPNVITWFAVLILAYALLSHSGQIAGLVKIATGG